MEGFRLDVVASGQPRRGEVVSITFSTAQLFNEELADFGLPGEGDKQRCYYGDIQEQKSKISQVTLYSAPLAYQTKQMERDKPESRRTDGFMSLLEITSELELLDW